MSAMGAGLAVFALISAMLWLQARKKAAGAARAAQWEISELKAALNRTETLLAAESRLLVVWPASGNAPVLSVGSSKGLGLPGNIESFLCFSDWLEAAYAGDIERRLTNLRENGEAFDAIVKMKSGPHLDMSGRAAGGCVTMRVRDVAGWRQEMGALYDRYEKLTADTAAMRAILDAAPQPAWARDSSGVLTWANPAYAAAVGAQNPQTAIAANLELIEGAGRRATDGTVTDGQSNRYCAMAIVNGQRRTFDVADAPLAAGRAAIADDVSERVAAQEELKHHITAHARTLNRIATAVAIFGADQRLLFHNAAYQELWGLDAEWLQTRPKDGEILDALRDAERLPQEVNYREWKAGQLACYATMETIENAWYLPDRQALRVIAEPHPFGGVTYLYENLTEQYDLESQLNSLIKVQRETLNNLHEGVAVFADNGRLKLFNPNYARIWHLDPNELLSQPHIDEVIDWCRAQMSDDQAWARIKGAVTALGDERRRIGGRLDRPDGSVIDYSGLPLSDGATLLTYVDMTDSVRRAEALEEAADIKNDFIHHVSYELRTPLQNVIGFAQVLADPGMGALQPRQREYTEHIRSESETLLAIIDSILDLATIDAGSMELTLGQVDMNASMRAAVAGIRDRALKANMSLNVRIAPEADGFIADGKRIIQVLYNLLSNAVKFSRPGGLIWLVCERQGDSVALSVADRGEGIAAEYQDRVFERFESHSGVAGKKGTGLGLSLVKSLVELHNGEVALVSEPGVGTTVTCLLPADPGKGKAPAGVAGLWAAALHARVNEQAASQPKTGGGEAPAESA